MTQDLTILLPQALMDRLDRRILIDLGVHDGSLIEGDPRLRRIHRGNLIEQFLAFLGKRSRRSATQVFEFNADKAALGLPGQQR